MEMTSNTGAGGMPKLMNDDDDPEETWPGTEKKRSLRVLLVGSLMALPLLAFFLLGRESTPMAWLQLTIAKLTATNHDGATHGHSDELLGGLLAPGMDRRSCQSRYESPAYYKHFPYAPSPHLLQKLRAYEARHRRCAPGTPLYAESVEQLRSGRSAAAMECKYVVWLPFDGLGNRMLSMVSGFLYALLTGRVLLVALPPDSDDLFCEPFPGTTWRLPAGDFPVADLVPRGQDIERSYTRLVERQVVGPAANATAAVPAYVYLSLGWLLRDGRLFFCGEHQAALGEVNWLLLYSDLYFAPSLYAVAEFRDELRLLFPAKESAHHLLSRYLLHPSNAVWSLVTGYYGEHLAPATWRIGVQVRMFGHSSIPADDMYGQILNCSRQENILPEPDGHGHGGGGANDTTAIFIASLYGDYYRRLRSRYSSAARVGVFQRTHEERQATASLAHNQRALAEIFLLSFSDELVTSGLSTFGYVSSGLAGVRPVILLTAFEHKVPETPCRRAVSMEPCNLTPPRGLQCRGQKAMDQDDFAHHVRVCEDFKDGVKFFD